MTQDRQKEFWEEEHRNPRLLPHLDSREASSGVKLFRDCLRGREGQLEGLEMGCGKGRNCLWLAREQVARMTGFDFSVAAIEEAQERNREGVRFLVHDATTPWPFSDAQFDFALDCFASTDIETRVGRESARDELYRVLKPGGWLLVYTLSTDEEFHGAMLERFPAHEPNSFWFPESNKVEKIFDRQELMEFYRDWEVVREERVDKTVRLFEKDYACRHFWLILRRP